MAFIPMDTKISDLLNEKVVFTIPRYQRNYVWKEKNIKQLIDDIFFTAKEVYGEEYFLGSLVLINGKLGTFDSYEIIDGQQRLTTLELCIFALIVIRKKQLKSGCADEKKENLERDIGYLQDFIFTRNPKEKSKPKLITEDEKFLQLCELCLSNEDVSIDKINDLILKNKKKNSYIRAFDIILNYLLTLTKNEDDNITKFESLFFNTRIIKITSDNEIVAYSIFETLNTRGLQLKQIELLKNFLFKYLSKGETIDLKKDEWLTLVHDFEENEIITDDFLHQFVRSYYGVDKIKSNDYEYIRSKEDYNSINNFYNCFMEYSKVYRDISIINECNDIEIRMFRYMQIKKISIIKSMLTSLKIKYNKKIISETMYCEIIDYLLKYFIGFYIIVNKNNINKKITELAYNIYKEESGKKIKILVLNFLVELQDLYPEQELGEKFAEIKYSNKFKRSNTNSSLITFLLQPLYNISNDDIEKCNIEHIVCDDQKNELTWKLGNLIPCPEDFNNKVLKDKSLEEKLKCYKESNITYLKEFSEEYKNFNEDIIPTRTEKVVKNLLDNYKLNFDEIKENIKKEKAILKVIELKNDDKRITKYLEEIPVNIIFNDFNNNEIISKDIIKLINEEYEKL